MDLARRNLEAALRLLQALIRQGAGPVVLCPGSRSGPLATAAGMLERRGLRLLTAVDERSAAFLALGCSRAGDGCAAVITTSGTAVANLLPAAVEADLGGIPLLLISADRPQRLKGCGANQTVNQEAFLACSVRAVLQGDGRGLAVMAPEALDQLGLRAMAATAAGPAAPAGPVHLNLPLEEPLHLDGPGLQAVASGLAMASSSPASASVPAAASVPMARPPWPRIGAAGLDPDQSGVVVAGPWRGRPQHWPAFLEALRRWQVRSGWPVLADGLSGLRGAAGLALVGGADLALDPVPADLLVGQVLRLGPMPASRRIQQFLQACGGHQVLISEQEPRRLDPLGTAALQWAGGLAGWLDQLPPGCLAGHPGAGSMALARRWRRLDQAVQQLLDRELVGEDWGEPALARQLSRLLPEGVPLVIANSSPVRDWDSFAVPGGTARAVHAFRGASGIDGTLSLACGVAEVQGRAVLLTGDLALLHDSNGWLWHGQLAGRLVVVLIDNGGGGIFEQLPIRPEGDGPLDFERLFAMPQAVNPVALAAAHGVPARSVSGPASLAADLAWALAQPMALLHVPTDRRRDAARRQALRRMASALAACP
ncbi:MULTISPECIES: 2-succinyl-5-enolpyruvyl-6-hydroxy-3-cyclohexene-1-carboxylic-acid synthase [Aphanothece]|uniref:2-succinyl-5-enolpyruvyl-6-hydroxy-3- cyclohexene-1-carboxylic-acid synthase n=1 Tax=Aphanothece TaxID=1121 RepID=UPI0039852C01